MEVEDEIVMQREYAKLMESREATTKRFQERRDREEKENRIVAGDDPEMRMDVDQEASSAISTDRPATIRGIERIDTEEVFN